MSPCVQKVPYGAPRQRFRSVSAMLRATAGHLLALRMVQSPTDIEFVGAIEHDTETLYRLLNEEPGSFSSSNSSRGSHHPSWECFMT